MSQDDFSAQRPEHSDEPRSRQPEYPSSPRQPAPTGGFPWAPVLIVGSIVGVLCCGGGVVGVVYLSITKVREAAARTQSTNNLRQIGLALHNCNSSWKEMPLASGPWKGTPQDKTDRSLFFHLLPYIEQDNLYKNALRNSAPTNQLVKTYISPADATGNGGQGECSYAANWQLFQLPIAPPGQEQAYPSIVRSFPDGPTNTIMVAEIYQNCNGTIRRWGQTGNASTLTTPAFNRVASYNPALINSQLQLFQVGPSQSDCSPPLAQTPHSGGMLVSLGDASVRSLSKNLSVTTWQRVCCPADGDKNPPITDW